jgi:hypothetical protein
MTYTEFLAAVPSTLGDRLQPAVADHLAVQLHL